MSRGIMSDFFTNVTRRGDAFLVRGYLNGKRYQHRVSYEPYIFTNIKNDDNTKYKTIHGKPAWKVTFNTVNDVWMYVKSSQGAYGLELYGFDDFLYPFIYDTFPGKIEYDSELITIGSIDIEVEKDSQGWSSASEARCAITAITLKVKDKIFAFGYNSFKHDDSIEYFHCKTEKELLLKFIDVWNKCDLDIITGWNIRGYDIPYIINRIGNVIGSKIASQLSPWGIIKKDFIEKFGKKEEVWDILGISILDYYELYREFTYIEQESYKLDYIAEFELGEKKIDYSQYGSLDRLYKENFQLYMEYNIKDSMLVSALEDKLGLIQLVLALSYEAKTNYITSLATVKPCDVRIHNYLMDQNIVVPWYNPPESDRTIIGGYVKEPIPGMYKWIVSFDLTSLYPMLIQQYNISPDVFVKMVSTNSIIELPSGKVPIESSNYSVASNGACFRKDKLGFAAVLMDKLFNDRKVYKNKMLEYKKEYEKTHSKESEKLSAKYGTLQMAIKILINSYYGASGNSAFRWFDNNLAEAVTSSGQLSILWIGRKVNEYFNRILKTENIEYVFYTDTDSFYLNLEPLVKTLNIDDEDKIVNIIDTFCNVKVQPYIIKAYNELFEYMGCYQNKMDMKREVIASKGIFVSKKRYTLLVHNSEGVQYTKPKIKVQGLEMVRSSTPKWARNKIEKSLTLIFHGTENDIIKYIAEIKEEFYTLNFKEVALPRSIGVPLENYYDASSIYRKGTPQHIRGALLWNSYIKENNLLSSYPTITTGERIRFTYLIMPNPFKDNTVAIPDSSILDIPFDKKYIDYDAQFKVAFLSPIKNILSVIGWNAEYVSNLNSLWD